MLRELEAEPTDVVFLDHMSMWQSPRRMPSIYATANNCVDAMAKYRYGMTTQTAANGQQTKEKRFALYESTRLYAFAGGSLPDGREVLGCRVIVLPRLEDPHDFPPGPATLMAVLQEDGNAELLALAAGEVREAKNNFCSPPRVEKLTAWGFAKSVPYASGGWTCTEYSVARINGTIANAHHADVRAVEAARDWPDDCAAFAEMLAEAKPDAELVAFTSKGDREAVRFNFFKYGFKFGETVPAGRS